MAAGQSDFTHSYASWQAGWPGLDAQPRSPEAVDAGPAGATDAGPTVPGFPGEPRTGRSGRKRDRYAWLYDDEDIWGAEGVDGAPTVIDGDDWRAPRI
jgi:hypothetical protein